MSNLLAPIICVITLYGLDQMLLAVNFYSKYKSANIARFIIQSMITGLIFGIYSHYNLDQSDSGIVYTVLTCLILLIAVFLIIIKSELYIWGLVFNVFIWLVFASFSSSLIQIILKTWN
jgi:hypothetical protein